MSRIKTGRKVSGSIVDILNREFSAKTNEGQSLAGWQRSAWPRSAPFFKEKWNSQDQTVVWLPYVTDNSKAEDVVRWLNVVNHDRIMAGASLERITAVSSRPPFGIESRYYITDSN